MTEEEQLRASPIGDALRRIGSVAESAGAHPNQLSHRPWLGRRRRSVALIILGAGLSATAATAAVLLSSDEVDQFARDASISRPVALAELAEQQRLFELDQRLRRDLGSQFAGVWVAEDGVTTVVGVTDERSAQIAALVRRSSAASGLTEVPTVRWQMRASIAAIEREQRTFQPLVDAANRGAPGMIDLEPDVRNNRLMVHVPQQPTRAQARVVQRMRRKATVPLTTRAGSPRFEFQPKTKVR